jgi:class 3 adenylate cyclase
LPHQLFGDIRGFTAISEGLTPGILLGHLNRTFDGMVDIVNRNEGAVNKNNRDNVMVVRGGPLMKDQARKTVECALEMQRWIMSEREKCGPDVSFGFGINTGPVVAGFLKGRTEPLPSGQINRLGRLTTPKPAPAPDVPIGRAAIAGYH